jgi:hypothetical protein
VVDLRGDTTPPPSFHQKITTKNVSKTQDLRPNMTDFGVAPFEISGSAIEFEMSTSNFSL